MQHHCLILVALALALAMLAVTTAKPLTSTPTAQRLALAAESEAGAGEKRHNAALLRRSLSLSHSTGAKMLSVTSAAAAPVLEQQEDTFKGALCILGGALMHLTLGSIYCWGNFASYAPTHLRFFDGGDREGTPDHMLTLPLTLVAQCLTIPLGPLVVAHVGSRATMILGALICGAGVYLSSYAQTLTQFLALYAVAFGGGVGIAYTAPMIAAWKWLPSKKGLVSGAILTGFGAGGFVFNLIGTRAINPNAHNPEADTGKFPQLVYDKFPAMLRTLGKLYVLVGMLGSLLVTEKKDTAGEGKNKSKNEQSAVAVAVAGSSVKEALRTPQFWLMWSMIICSASAGLNVASIYKKFAADSPALAGDAFQAMVGGLGALFNGVGRLFWGSISDSIGFKNSFMSLAVLQAALHAYYPYSGGSKLTFGAATCACFFFLAGNFALMPPAIQRMFGAKNGALIYGLVYSAFGVASMGGLMLGKSLQNLYGLERVFHVMSAMSVLGALITARLSPLKSLPGSAV